MNKTISKVVFEIKFIFMQITNYYSRFCRSEIDKLHIQQHTHNFKICMIEGTSIIKSQFIFNEIIVTLLTSNGNLILFTLTCRINQIKCG